MSQICPKCGFNGSNSTECPQCGINFEGYRHFLQHQGAVASGVPANFSKSESKDLFSFDGIKDICVQQNEDAIRIFTGWPTCNHYSLMNFAGETIGYLAERKGGFWNFISRLFLGNRRPLVLDIIDLNGDLIANLNRPFFWFFSQLFVTNNRHQPVGSVGRRFGVFRNIYSLYRTNNFLFANLKSTIMGGRTIGDAILGNETFAAFDSEGRDTGACIAREWKGALTRIFTDEDSFIISFAANWTAEQKLVLLAAAISIDFDFYESKPSVATRAGITGTILSNVLGGKSEE
ncbi:MAG: hypothetical protein JWQ35_803 [Bacteriovoracaceae bacterium]|nr:hypothetical protein [Bacteriovoracaceae bacterium]